MEVFAGPQQTPPRVSLISSAELVPVEGARWEGGFIADLDGFGNPLTTSVCDETDLTVGDRSGGALSFKPYTIYATNKRNTYGTEADDVTGFYDAAQRKLLAGESTVLESILWDGYAGLLNENPFLTDGAGDYTPNAEGIESCAAVAAPTTISSAVTAVKDAFAILENEMGEFSASRGMIHLRVQAFHALVEARTVRREGNVWLSPMDNIVVPGRGYAGTGPAGQAVGATEWMYGHAGIVQVRRGDIVRLGESQALDNITTHGWNDQEVIVQRAAHVLLDPYAKVFAIDFNALG